VAKLEGFWEDGGLVAGGVAAFMMKRFLSRIHLGVRWGLAIACVGLSIYVGVLPGLRLVFYLRDPALRDGRMPVAAWDLSRTLAPRYAAWAKARVGRENDPKSVSGTEWPLFGSVFYLQGLEALQEAWLRDPSLSKVAPAVYSKDAIEAAAALIVAPGQAKWVQDYWGKDYLHHADLFYRYLLISGMTSYTRLTGDGKYLGPLRDQVESLSAELDASPHGFLDDYPNQCYPPDIISALAAIRRADGVLHTNHGAILQRALRAFTPPFADAHGLPSYNVVADSGVALQPSRGTGDSFNLAMTPELWPAQSAAWYRTYADQFWQKRDGLVGFREYAKDTPAAEQFADVDSGPVILGYGVAASAFGVAAAHAQGDMERAAPLTAEMLVSSCPLPDGTLLVPKLLSDCTDAPYLGEAGILFCLTRPVPEGTAPVSSVMTPFVWLVMVAYFGLALFLLLPVVMLVRERGGGEVRDRSASPG
jgi:hypothetical protein